MSLLQYIPSFLWMGHHQGRRLAHWYWNGSQHLEGGHAWMRPNHTALPTHLFMRHFKVGSARTTLGMYFIWIYNANIHTYMSHFMEIQQRDNETLAAYVHCFKTEDKRCDYNSYTTLICIFVKVLWMYTTMWWRSMKRTSRPNWQLSNQWRSSTQHKQVTAIMTPLTVNMVSNDDRCCERQVILVATSPMHSVITAMILVISPRTAQRKFLNQEHLLWWQTALLITLWLQLQGQITVPSLQKQPGKMLV